MSKQPFYHLRPNKHIDRTLFVQTLVGLGREYPISEYCYTGFGSYQFDDFRLIHEVLNIKNMKSLESDVKIWKRACYNCPYKCIDVLNKASKEYIDSLSIESGERNIFWLDYVSPQELYSQVSDFRNLLSLLDEGDIVRITLNANPSSLGGETLKGDEQHSYRLSQLMSRLPDDIFPVGISEEDMIHSKYPLVLLEALRRATLLLTPRKKVLPLFSTVYTDGGHQMLTMTMIITYSDFTKPKLEAALKPYDHVNFSWNKPSVINIPELTQIEQVEINRMLPDQESIQAIQEKFPYIFDSRDDTEISSYAMYYKYYPRFQKTSL